MRSNHSSPQHAQCAAMSSSLQETGNDVNHYGHVAAESQYCAASAQRHCAECSRHCCVKQQVQVADVAQIITENVQQWNVWLEFIVLREDAL